MNLTDPTQLHGVINGFYPLSLGSSSSRHILHNLPESFSLISASAPLRPPTTAGFKLTPYAPKLIGGKLS